MNNRQKTLTLKVMRQSGCDPIIYLTLLPPRAPQRRSTEICKAVFLDSPSPRAEDIVGNLFAKSGSSCSEMRLLPPCVQKRMSDMGI